MPRSLKKSGVHPMVVQDCAGVRHVARGCDMQHHAYLMKHNGYDAVLGICGHSCRWRRYVSNDVSDATCIVCIAGPRESCQDPHTGLPS